VSGGRAGSGPRALTVTDGPGVATPGSPFATPYRHPLATIR
jgi:hypothetical protein